MTLQTLCLVLLVLFAFLLVSFNYSIRILDTRPFQVQDLQILPLILYVDISLSYSVLQCKKMLMLVRFSVFPFMLMLLESCKKL